MASVQIFSRVGDRNQLVSISAWSSNEEVSEQVEGASNRATENTASEESMIHRWIEEVEKLVGLQRGSSFSGKVAHGGCFFGEFSRTTPRPEYFSSRKRISELINWDFSEEVCWFIGRFRCAVFGRYARDTRKNETSLFLAILWFWKKIERREF